MPAVYDGYELEIVYTVNGLQHVARLKVVPDGSPSLGMAFGDINVLNRASGVTILEDVVEGVAALMQPLYGAADDIERCDLYKQIEGSDGREYISSHDLGLAGTGSAGISATQTIFMFRTTAGKIAKFYLQELNYNANTLLRPPYPVGALADLADYIAAADTAFLGGDEAYIAQSRGILSGQSEILWRKRFRP